MTDTINTRELIMNILLEMDREKTPCHLAVRDALDKYLFLPRQDRAFIKRVCEGTVEYGIQNDYIINQYSKIKINKCKPVIRAILRMSVYQIRFLDAVPDSAVVNEAVKLATKKGFASLKGFVNGVLRNIERNLDNITYPDEANLLEYLSVEYSMPEWILQKWLAQYDRATVETMLADFQMERPTTIRVNRNVMTKNELIESLENQGVHVENHPYLSDALWITSYDYLADLDSFQKGAFHVQDISSMLVAHLANPQEGDTVIDVCAAPGGKSLHMAELLRGTGHVEARDLTDYKVNLIRENIERSGMKNIEAVCQDATDFDEESVEKADIVVADLPCSGLGVLGKKTDLKYKMTEQTQKDLVALQREILSKVKSYVKPGGTLIYSTCTIHEAENMGNVDWFLAENKEFELASVKEDLCEELSRNVVNEGCLQLLPGIHKSDGFFIAKFKKVEYE